MQVKMQKVLKQNHHRKIKRKQHKNLQKKHFYIQIKKQAEKRGIWLTRLEDVQFFPSFKSKQILQKTHQN